MPDRAALWFAALITLCAGCLPSSCQRIASRAVSSPDSLSRQIAAQVLPDTLGVEGALRGSDAANLAYPRTVLFTASDGIVVSDAERNSLFYFDAHGFFVREVDWEGASVPYLAELRGDTAIVFSPGSRRIDYIVNNGPVHAQPTPDDLEAAALQYVTTARAGTFLKVAGKDIAPFLAQLGADGTITQRVPLKGSAWRHAGPLRVSGDSLLSFSGFFPVVDVHMLPLRNAADSVVLKGFDSPMLARTYAFTQGEGRGAPLLMSAAALAGPYLFALNLRPGWLRIDVYNHAGLLQNVLIEPDPGYNRNYYPVDIAVQQHASGAYRIAVAIVEPEPVVRLYRWRPHQAAQRHSS